MSETGFNAKAKLLVSEIKNANVYGLEQRDFSSPAMPDNDSATLTVEAATDAEVQLSACDLGLTGWLERLSPHGLGNSKPVFVARDVTASRVTTVGGGKHVRMTVADATGAAEAIGFGMGERSGEISRAGRCDVAFAPSRNEWMGESRVQLKLKGVRVR